MEMHYYYLLTLVFFCIVSSSRGIKEKKELALFFYSGNYGNELWIICKNGQYFLRYDSSYSIDLKSLLMICIQAKKRNNTLYKCLLGDQSLAHVVYLGTTRLVFE